MIVFFDIGSTLIEGPPFGPARRLTELLKLEPSAARDLEHLLFRIRSRNPEELAGHISRKLNVDHNAAMEACTSLWNAQLDEAYVLPGAREVIASLTEANIPRAYLSNIWPPFYEHFRRQFAEESNQPQFLSFETGFLKPDPEFFLHAMREAGARPEETIMVGDTYNNDIEPAIKLGMRTAWVLHRPQKEQAALVRVLNGEAPAPDLTIKSIGELTPCKLSNIISSAKTNSSGA